MNIFHTKNLQNLYKMCLFQCRRIFSNYFQIVNFKGMWINALNCLQYYNTLISHSSRLCDELEALLVNGEPCKRWRLKYQYRTPCLMSISCCILCNKLLTNSLETFFIGFFWKTCRILSIKAHVFTFPMTTHPLQLVTFEGRYDTLNNKPNVPKFNILSVDQSIIHSKSWGEKG